MYRCGRLKWVAATLLLCSAPVVLAGTPNFDGVWERFPDPYVERGRELARRIAGSRLLIVPESGHLIQEDAPEAIVAALLGDLCVARVAG